LNQVLETIHSKLRQSIYLNSSSGKETICILVDGKNSAVEKESFAWDMLNIIVHEAAISTVPGNKFSRDLSKILKEKIISP